MECLWCDAPTTNGDKLCPACRVVNDHPLFYCSNPRHTVPTLGPSCASCDHERAEKDRLAKRNAPIIAQLVAIRAQLVAEWHRPWPGCEHGKAIIGMAINGAIKDLS